MRIFHVVIALTMISGCAAPAVTSDISQLTKSGAAEFGNDFLVFDVPSSGGIEDASFIALSKAAPSGMSKQLSEVLLSAETKDVQIVVGGPNSAKTKVVIEGALELLEDRNLQFLRLMFVGNVDDTSAIRNMVSEAGGEFFTASD